MGAPRPAVARRGAGHCETHCWREIPLTTCSCSDSARSRLTIRAFSSFSAFLGLPVRARIVIASTASALATPTNTMVVIYAVLLAWVLKPVVQDRNCALAGVAVDRSRRSLSANYALFQRFHVRLLVPQDPARC